MKQTELFFWVLAMIVTLATLYLLEEILINSLPEL